MLKPGFNSDHVLLASLDVFPSGYDETKGLVFYTQVLARLKTVSGVQSISFADKLPLAIFGDTSQGASIEGYTPGRHEDLNFQFDTVGPDYFQTLNIPLAAGATSPNGTTRMHPASPSSTKQWRIATGRIAIQSANECALATNNQSKKHNGERGKATLARLVRHYRAGIGFDAAHRSWIVD